MTEAGAENTAAAGKVDEHQARQVEISLLLKKRAPLMCPSVVPRAFKEALASVHAFLASDAGKLAASASGGSAADAGGGAESTEEAEKEEKEVGGEDDGGRHVVLTTETDIATRTFRITAAKFGKKVDAVLSNLELLMELHLNASQEELEPYVTRFASANKLDVSSNRSAATALQEVCSLAYSLQVAASNIPGWTGFVGSSQLPLGDDADMAAIGKELFIPPTPPTSPRPKSPSRKKGKSRSQSKPAKKKAASPARGAATVTVVGGESVVKEKGEKGAARGSKRKK
eukprot:g14011.t1